MAADDDDKQIPEHPGGMIDYLFLSRLFASPINVGATQFTTLHSSSTLVLRPPPNTSLLPSLHTLGGSGAKKNSCQICGHALM